MLSTYKVVGNIFSSFILVEVSSFSAETGEWSVSTLSSLWLPSHVLKQKKIAYIIHNKNQRPRNTYIIIMSRLLTLLCSPYTNELDGSMLNHVDCKNRSVIKIVTYLDVFYPISFYNVFIVHVCYIIKLYGIKTLKNV